MLSDHQLQLLTAFVDGELSQQERMAAMRLLNQSSEAREILRQLQENAHKLKNLPRHAVEPSLVGEIMEALAAGQSQVKPAAHARRRRWAPYFAATLAASLLAAVIGILFWQATQRPDDSPLNEGPGFAQIPDKKPEPKPEPVPAPKKVNPLLADLSKMTEVIVRDFGAPLLEEKPFSAAFADLRKDGKAVGQFVHEVNREKSLLLNVTVKKNSEAMARLQSVLKDQGVTVLVDSAAKKVVDDKKTEYLVYADHLTSSELARLMNELGDSYVVGLNNKQKNVPSPYQSVTMTPLPGEEKQKLTKILGVDTLERKDGKPESKERVVLLAPSVAGAVPSTEAKQFAAQRRAGQPGTVQVLIRIRQE